MIEGLRYAFPKTMGDSNRNTRDWSLRKRVPPFGYDGAAEMEK